ncbi:MAG: ADP-ribosylation factor-like protein [Promethearchaeota archaeon]
MKTLIFGPANVGKTSLMQTTCLGYSFMKVSDLKPTKGVSRESYVFRGLLELNVWDAGGQERYLEKYFSDSKTAIFSEVDIAIFMVDAISLDKRIRELFEDFIAAIREYSPNLKKIYALINKIDLEDSREDDVYNLLMDNLDENIKKMCEVTPVSVKLGSAQHRLIEILDTNLQNSILEMQKLNRIRAQLESIKSKTNCQAILFNKSDGLVISSTIGKFQSEPLRFLRMEIGSLESNIHSIFSKIMLFLKNKTMPIDLSLIIYESNELYVLLKQIDEKAILILISPDKSKDSIPKVLDVFAESESPVIKIREFLK